MDGLSDRLTDMLTVLALNQKMAFIAKNLFSPIGCDPVPIFAESSLFFFMVAVKSCFFTGLLVSPNTVKSLSLYHSDR